MREEGGGTGVGHWGMVGTGERHWEVAGYWGRVLGVGGYWGRTLEGAGGEEGSAAECRKCWRKGGGRQKVRFEGEREGTGREIPCS